MIVRRRFLTLFLQIGWIIWLTFLSACSPGASPVPDLTQTPLVSPSSLPRLTTPAPASQTPITEPTSSLGLDSEDIRGQIIKFWFPWIDPTGAAVLELVEEFNLNNNWGIIVVPTEISGYDELSAQVTQSLQSNTSPDLVVAYPHQAAAWVNGEKLADLTPFIHDPVWGWSAFEQADFFPELWQPPAPDEIRSSVPAQRFTQVILYNQTWADSLGFSDPPESLDQFKEQACAAAKGNLIDADTANNGTGGWIISTHYTAILGWLYAFGSEPVSGESSVVSPYRFDTPASLSAFNFLRELYDQGCAWLPESQYPETEFATRQGLFSTLSVADLPYQAQAFQKAGSSDAWTVLPFPSASSPSLSAYGPSYLVLSTSPERQLAVWVFLKWLLSPDSQADFIEASGSLPLQASVFTQLGNYSRRNPQWAAAVELIPLARTEPNIPSWNVVRWTLSDAATQLFRSYFSVDQVPSLLEYLEWLAGDLHSRTLSVQPTGLASPPRGHPELTPLPSLSPAP